MSKKLLEDICSIVRSCGEIIKNADREHIAIDEKTGLANFVTEYDKKIEAILRKELLALVPDARFIGEEGDQAEFDKEHKFFIVDPIDGTTNFIKDYRMSCISVALIEGGEAKIGVVYNPYSDEMFTAIAGEGAYCNGKRIHVSDEPLENGLVLFGAAPYYEELYEETFKRAFEYFKRGLDLRRSGSAAIDLCTIAAGRAELYFELRLYPWDHAAGSLMVKEAGGVVTTVDGEPLPYDRPSSVLATNKRIAKEL
ncbi:inositol monophosphatase [Butyrivibrio sp. CB08]|uniref:inositol monophosphatase family protein n=1 Tax=Butyrivibrio sp. CB08 TaxID=2364879 RepID=UPI000EA9D9E4|nr:inositol monophosphatase family protein [Butyrivibrio sp. CB08]RKM59774.1 inositol monophosphatase [Butyrivibrio sp. CB08]